MVAFDSPSPGGMLWLPEYPIMSFPMEFVLLNCPEEFLQYQTTDPIGSFIHTEIEYALAISPVSADTCDLQMPGDVNGDTNIDGSDVTYLTAYLYAGGPAPTPMANGDPDGDCDIDQADLDYLIDFVFGTGDSPVDCTCQNPPTTGCCIDYRGNADGDNNENLNISDITYLVAYCFGGGPIPVCVEEGNADGDNEEKINISDITCLVAYCFGGGPHPEECPTW